MVLQQIVTLFTTLNSYVTSSQDNEELSKRTKDAVEFLNVFTTVVQTVGVTDQKMQQLTNTVQAMVNEERSPTEDELNILLARSDSAHDRIQNVEIETAGSVGSEAPSAPAGIGASSGGE